MYNNDKWMNDIDHTWVLIGCLSSITSNICLQMNVNPFMRDKLQSSTNGWKGYSSMHEWNIISIHGNWMSFIHYVWHLSMTSIHEMDVNHEWMDEKHSSLHEWHMSIHDSWISSILHKWHFLTTNDLHY